VCKVCVETLQRCWHYLDFLARRLLDRVKMYQSPLSSKERVQQRTVEQVVDVPVPQVVEEVIEVAKVIPQERVQQRTVEQVVDVPVPQIVEEILEQVVDVPVPQVVEEVVEIAKVIPQERVQQRTVEQVVDVPVPVPVPMAPPCATPSCGVAMPEIVAMPAPTRKLQQPHGC